MVLGLGSKKGATVKVEFLIQIQEIKPWKVPAVNKPLTVQWQRGDNRYGKTKNALPSQIDGGKVVFNDGFRLPATLVRESEGKGKNAGIARFQKKTVVFSLLESATDLQLAKCVLDLAEYGDLDSRVPATVPLAVGKKVDTGGQSPALFLTIGPFKLSEKSFNSRSSFGSSTPRTSISQGPEPKAEAKAGEAKVSDAKAREAKASTSGKAKVEPALDDETRKSIVAALLSDEDDNVSIESFTDDEGTPGSSTPRSETTQKSSAQGSDVSKASTIASKSSATATRSDAAKPPDLSGSAIQARKHPTPATEATSTTKPSNVATDAISTSNSAAEAASRTMNRRNSGPNSTPPQFPASKPYESSPDSSSKSLNAPSPASSTNSSRDASQTPVEASVSSINSTFRRPVPTKHGGPKGLQARAPGTAVEKAEEPVKQKAEEKAIEPQQSLTKHSSDGTESTAGREDTSKISRSGVPTPDPVGQLSATEEISKPTSGADTFGIQPTTGKTKDDADSLREASESQEVSKANLKQQYEIKKKNEHSVETTSSTESASVNVGNAGKIIRSSADSMGASRILAGTPANRLRSNSLSDSLPALEMPRTESAKSSRGSSPQGKGRDEKFSSTAFSAPPTAKALSEGVANITERPIVLSKGSSSDLSDSESEDYRSESVLSRLSRNRAPLHDKARVPEAAAIIKRGSAFPVSAGVSTASEGSKTIESTVGSRKTEREGMSIVGKKNTNEKAVGNTSIGSNSSKDLPGAAVPANSSALGSEEDQEEGTSVLGSARASLAKVETRALDELRAKVASAEAKLAAETQKVEKLRGELQDIGAMEVSLYSIVAEHGNSAHKLHTPARRLARIYMHAYKHWSPERRAGTAKNCISGLLTITRSCGSDVSRLNFWWSNIVVLRTILVQAVDNGLSPGVQPAPRTNDAKSGLTIEVNGKSSGWAKSRTTVYRPTSYSRRPSALDSEKKHSPSNDWQSASTFFGALERIEEWIYSKIIESLWWQAMIPRMQKNMDTSAPSSPRGMAMLSPSALFGSEFTNKAKEDLSKMAGDVTGIFVRKPSKKSTVNLPELGDARQGYHSAEIWKKAMTEALCRLCPVRGAGHDCGCLPMLVRTALEGCAERLDVALFNAILREPDDDVPTDPISDPVSDPNVLPISARGLTFGGGVQLKNVVVTWSSFIMGLVQVKEPVFEADIESTENAEDDMDKAPKFFKLIKATGDLLMLPKDSFMDKNMRKEESREEPGKIATLFVFLKSTGDILQLPKDLLMDRSVRREICPMLSVDLIRRILVNFSPDEFAPDPIAPSLLAALNTEASLERQRHGGAFDNSASASMASAPSVTYVVPLAQSIWPWIGEWSPEPPTWGRSSKSLLRKGYTSDEDLNFMKSVQNSSSSDQLEFLTGKLKKGKAESPANGSHKQQSSPNKNQSLTDISLATRFELLEEVWANP